MFGIFFDQRSPTDQFATPSAPISARIPQLSGVFSNSSWSQTILPSLIPFDSSVRSTINNPSFSLKQESFFNINLLTRHGISQDVIANNLHSIAFILSALCGLGFIVYFVHTREEEQLGKKVSRKIRKATSLAERVTFCLHSLRTALFSRLTF